MQSLLSLESLDHVLADRLFAVVAQGHDRVTFDQLIIAKANCLKVLTCIAKTCTSPGRHLQETSANFSFQSSFASAQYEYAPDLCMQRTTDDRNHRIWPAVTAVPGMTEPRTEATLLYAGNR